MLFAVWARGKRFKFAVADAHQTRAGARGQRVARHALRMTEQNAASEFTTLKELTPEICVTIWQGLPCGTKSSRGEMTRQRDITFAPPLVVSGAKQNISTSDDTFGILEGESTIQHGAASAVLQQNLMYHKDAFTFVTADLPLMEDAAKSVRRVQDGLSIRVWQGSDIRNDELLMRLDILYGFKTLRPEWACRISN